jgi:hypothetical protein
MSSLFMSALHIAIQSRPALASDGMLLPLPSCMRLFLGHRLQVEGIAGPTALEALENVFALIRGEAAARARG